MQKKKLTAPLPSSRALRIAMEDTETSHFIRTNFSYPEKNPDIRSHKWISKDWQGYKWNIEIIEKHKFIPGKAKELLNIARLEIDSEGRITKRQFLRNILENEYKKYFGKKRIFDRQRRALSDKSVEMKGKKNINRRSKG